MAQDTQAARVLPACRVDDRQATPVARPKPVVQPYSALFAAFDEEDTRRLPKLAREDQSGVRLSPRRAASKLPPPHPLAAACRARPSELPPSPFQFQAFSADPDDEEITQRLRRVRKDARAPATPPPLPAAAPKVAPAPSVERAARPVLEVGVGRLSDSNFYTGFEPVISSGGVFIATQRRLPIGARVSVRVFVAGSRLDLEGYVHWTRQTHCGAIPDGLGVRLEPIPPAARELVHRFMQVREPLFFPDC